MAGILAAVAAHKSDSALQLIMVEVAETKLGTGRKYNSTVGQMLN